MRTSLLQSLRILHLAAFTLIGASPGALAAPFRGFIRVPGHYDLGEGTRIEVTKDADFGKPSIKTTWQTEASGPGGYTPINWCKSAEWFAFAEGPGRIWLFDGGVSVMVFGWDVRGERLPDAPKELRDVLPERVRNYYGLPGGPFLPFVRTPVPDTLVLKGISGTGQRRLVLINNATLAVGEEGRVRVGTSNVMLRCEDIRQRSAIVRVKGAKKATELFIGKE